ncbi:MAG: flippase-like domain-containing protein [Vampirovibrionales bacterium]|nr:flippase-like domain-containing protein [Vampirovibrionales bacterium]
MARTSVKTAIKIVLSIVLLGIALYYAGIQKTIGELSSSNLAYIPLGVAIYLLSQWLSSYRWQFLARRLEFHLPLRQFFDFYMLGMYFNLFLPGSIGGDVSRVYYLAKAQNRRKREALLTLLAERGVGMAALLLLTGALCLTPDAAPIPAWLRQSILLLCALMGGGYVALLIAPISRWAERIPKLGLLAQAQPYWRDFPLLAKSVALSLAVQGMMIGIQLMIAHALGITVQPLYLTAVYGIVTLVSVTPLFFNGIGVREGAYQWLLMKVGVSAHAAMAFGLYWFLISTLTSLCGAWTLFRGYYRAPAPAEAAS